MDQDCLFIPECDNDFNENAQSVYSYFVRTIVPLVQHLTLSSLVSRSFFSWNYCILIFHCLLLLKVHTTEIFAMKRNLFNWLFIKPDCHDLWRFTRLTRQKYLEIFELWTYWLFQLCSYFRIYQVNYDMRYPYLQGFNQTEIYYKNASTFSCWGYNGAIYIDHSVSIRGLYNIECSSFN